MSLVVTDEATLRALVAEEIQKALASCPCRSSMPGPSEDTLMTTAELQGLLRVDARTLRRMVRAGAIPAPIILGDRTLRWRRDVIDKWLSHLEKKTLRSGPHTGSVVVP